MGSFLVAENAAPARSKIKRPIIVLSHGYTGNPHQLSWLIKGLVNQGFIVLDIQHLDLIDDLPHLNHWKRAQDVSQMITHFQRHILSQSADLNKIGIAGYSYINLRRHFKGMLHACRLQHSPKNFLIPTTHFYPFCIPFKSFFMIFGIPITLR